MESLDTELQQSPPTMHSSPSTVPPSDLSSSRRSSTDSLWTAANSKKLTVCHFEEVVAEGLHLEAKAIETRNDYDYMRFIACGIGPSTMPLLVHHRLSESSSAYVQRFYGLITGISYTIIPHGTLTLDPSLLWLRPLPEDLHLKHIFSHSGKKHTVPLSRAACLPIGRMNDHATLYLFFPLLPVHGKVLSEAHSRQAWDLVITPSADATEGQREVDTINPDNLSRFAQLIRTRANDQKTLHWFQNFVFVYVSQAPQSYHALDLDERRSSFLAHLGEEELSLAAMARDVVNGGVWLVDIGLEVSQSQLSVAWVTEGRRAVVEALFGVRYDEDQYEEESFSHMTGVSNAQITPPWEPALNPPFPPAHIQFNVNDVHPQPVDECGEPVKFVSAADLVRCPEGFQSYLSRLSSEYESLCDFKISANAVGRFHIGACIHALGDIGQLGPYISESCATFETADIWTWRSMRCDVMNLLLKRIRRRYNVLHERPQSGMLLLGAIPWLVNSLNSGCINVLETGRLRFPACNASGIIFLQDIAYPSRSEFDIPHFLGIGAQDCLTDEQFFPFLGVSKTSMLDAYAEDNEPIPSDPPPMPSPHGLRKFRAVFPTFGQTPPRIHQSSIETDGDIPRQKNSAIELTMDPYIEELTKIIGGKFFSAVLLQSPKVVRRLVTTATMQDQRFFQADYLPYIFKAVRYKLATNDDWERAFACFFPPRSVIRGGVYPPFAHHAYFAYYVALVDHLSDHSFSLLRRCIWSTFFQDLYWIPRPRQDAIWTRSPKALFKAAGSKKKRRDAVCILINGVEPVFREGV